MKNLFCTSGPGEGRGGGIVVASEGEGKDTSRGDEKASVGGATVYREPPPFLETEAQQRGFVTPSDEADEVFIP